MRTRPGENTLPTRPVVCPRGRLRVPGPCCTRPQKSTAGIATKFPRGILRRRCFRLHALGAMVVVNVLDLVAEHRRQFVFAVHQRHQSRADVNMPAGQRKGIHKIHIWNVVKLVGQFAMGPCRHLGPHAAHVILHQLVSCCFCSERPVEASVGDTRNYASPTRLPMSISSWSERRVAAIGRRLNSHSESAMK